MEKKQAVLARLEELGLVWEITEHEAVYTIADMEPLLPMGTVCKNLLLRDAKGKNHYLVVAREEVALDLKHIATLLASTKLSFASPEQLERYLGVAPGSVSPFGILNDTEHAVTVVLDAGLRGKERLGVHPNDNTATVWLSFDNLYKFIEAQGNTCSIMELL